MSSSLPRSLDPSSSSSAPCGKAGDEMMTSSAVGSASVTGKGPGLALSLMPHGARAFGSEQQMCGAVGEGGLVEHGDAGSLAGGAEGDGAGLVDGQCAKVESARYVDRDGGARERVALARNEGELAGRCS